MGSFNALFSSGFLVINGFLFLITGIAALFFSFSAYLQGLGVDLATTGLILSADALAALVVQALISPLVHPGNAQRWLAGGSLLLSAALLMLAQVSTTPWLLVARLLQGTGFIAVLSALVSLLVCHIPAGLSGRAFGWSSLIRLLPYAVIPLTFDVFSIAPASFPRVLEVGALVALAPLALLLLPSVSVAGTAAESVPPAPGLAGLADSLRRRSVRALLGSALLFFCGYAAIFFFLKSFGRTLGIANADLFFTVATLVMIFIRIATGWLFDRVDKRWMGFAGMFAAALSYALLPLGDSRALFLGLAALSGLGWGIAMPLQAALMFDVSAPAFRGMNQNLLMLMMQGGFFIGPFAGGLAIAQYGYPAFFLGIAALTLAAGGLMFGARPPVSAGEGGV